MHKMLLPKSMMQLLDACASSLWLSQTSSDIWYGSGTRLSYAQTSQTAGLETNIQSSYYYEVGTSGNALKCHIISAGLWVDYLETSLFISIYQTAVGIICTVKFEFANEASTFQYKLCENHDPTVQPVITYIYLCGQIYSSCLSYFSNRPSRTGQKLN
jgi:hypothetical protein